MATTYYNVPGSFMSTYYPPSKKPIKIYGATTPAVNITE